MKKTKENQKPKHVRPVEIENLDKYFVGIKESVGNVQEQRSRLIPFHIVALRPNRVRFNNLLTWLRVAIVEDIGSWNSRLSVESLLEVEDFVRIRLDFELG